MSQQAPDPLEFLKALWGTMGLPGAGMMVPTLDVAELERRLAELRAVENWLTMNLSLLRMAIQGMEAQKAALNAMQGGTGSSGTPPLHPALEAWFKAMQAATGGGDKPPGQK